MDSYRKWQISQSDCEISCNSGKIKFLRRLKEGHLLFFDFTTVFVDTRLWKTKHLRKRFQNFRQSYVLLTDRMEIHQSQPLA